MKPLPSASASEPASAKIAGWRAEAERGALVRAVGADRRQRTEARRAEANPDHRGGAGFERLRILGYLLRQTIAGMNDTAR